MPSLDAGIGILSVKAKMHTIGNEVVGGVIAAVKEAGGTLDGLRQVFGLANLRDMPDDIALLVLSRNLA